MSDNIQTLNILQKPWGGRDFILANSVIVFNVMEIILNIVLNILENVLNPVLYIIEKFLTPC
jgi:hypothetical protein